MLLQLIFNKLYLSISVAVLDIKSETGCHNSTNNSTYISISCTVSCGLPVITLNGNFTFHFITNELQTKTCVNSSNVITSCNYLQCPVTLDPTINITHKKQGFISTHKLTSCTYTVACKSSEPNCTQKTENTFLLKECDVIPVPKCSVPSTTVTKVLFNTTTVTLATTVTSSILEVLPCSCSQLFTNDVIEPTCDCTSCYDIISTSAISLIPTTISCNMSSQLPDTYSTTSVPEFSPEVTSPRNSLSQSGKSIIIHYHKYTLYTLSIVIVPVTFTDHDQ